MSNPIRITVLVENSVHTRGLKAEHGLAWHLEFGSHQLLFDAGQTDLLIENARHLDVALDQLDAVVLSHGHYDHCGGLPAVIQRSPQARVFLHPEALSPKFSLPPHGASRRVDMPDTSRSALERNQGRVVENRTCTEVVPGLFLTGEIPRQTEFEDVGGRFFLDAQGTQPDPLTDDQALFCDTPAGVVVLLGCGHAGVVNTLHHIRRLTNHRPIHAVVGGFHLLNANAHRLDRTVAGLRDLGIDRLGPAHCTGMLATARLWSEFSGQCLAVSVGSRLVFER
jgi:7,8-dihydropterin-6-yl-methyl-4-(beta-D-ribofuranosyl)aminobenzene 5'-phosphate synthase